MKQFLNSGARTLLMAGASLVAFSTSAMAQSAASAVDMNVPAQDLGAALSEAGRQIGRDIIVPAASVNGRRSAPVQGRYSPEDGIRILLMGTGLGVRLNDSGTLIVQQSPLFDPAAIQVDEVVVTGSRIARRDADTPAPTTVVDRQLMDQSVAVNVADVLRELPSTGVGLGSANAFRNADAGAAFIDLRGLGVNRSLTLINGRRRVSGSSMSSAVDINTIPAAMLDRVEVITGGASAVYGADAVSGVANLITRHVDGVEMSMRAGVSEHGGADNYAASLLAGRDFAQGRGRANIGLSYTRSEALRANERGFGAKRVSSEGNPANTGPNDGIPDRITLVDFNDSYATYEANIYLNNTTYVYGPQGLEPLKAPIFRPGSLGAVVGDTGASFSDWFELRSPSEVYAVRGDINYRVTDAIEAFAELEYADTSGSNIEQFFRADERNIWLNGLGGPIIRIDNPFMPDAVRGLLADAGRDRIAVRKVYREFGEIENIHDRRTMTLVGGLKGRIDDRFDWQVFFQSGRFEDDVRTTNLPIASKFHAAVDVVLDPVSGQPTCRSAAARQEGCVPYDIFSGAAPTQAQRDYFLHTRLQEIENTQQVWGAQFSGPLFELPAGPVAFAAGVERRTESLKTKDDPLSLNNEVTFVGLATPRPPVDADFAVNEAYLELRAPLVANLTGVQALDLEGALRVSDYDTIGRTTAWNTALVYAPVQDLRFRVSASRSVRAPNLMELFGPQTVTLTNFVDPCDLTRINETANRLANCRALGIPEGFRDTFAATRFTTGGNPDLKAETADSVTAGVVVRPRFAQGLRITADYYDIKIKDAVTTFAATTIADRCVDSASIDNVFCSLISFGSDYNLDAILGANVNVASLTTKGIDFSVAYARELPAGWSADVRLLGNYLIKKERSADPSDPRSLVIDDGGYGDPRLRLSLSTRVRRGPITAGMVNTFISESDVNPQATQEAYDIPKVEERIYTRVFAAYDLSERYRISFGVDNLFDTKPPFTAFTYLGGGGGQSNAARYDNVGRFYSLGVTARF
ncbi:TonB-dependent receptor [Aquamicrobium terrae]|uniref:Outer membrane receptor protein involved in Fe transport n=1 Tax=Aquamicrobium terrae TaxID=1324945 RepID=A0ABV2N6B7_9HYPH